MGAPSPGSIRVLIKRCCKPHPPAQPGHMRRRAELRARGTRSRRLPARRSRPPRRRAGWRVTPCTTLLKDSIQIDEAGGAKTGYIRASGMTPARIAVSALTRSAIAIEIYPRREALAFLGPPPPVSAEVSPAKMRHSGRAGHCSRCWRLPARLALTRQREVRRR
jgi:hypothetical protein